MKESPPVLHPQASTKSSTQSTPPVAPPVERLVPGEHHGPIIPHPHSYTSTLVPPPVSDPITPLVTGTEETSAPPSPESLTNPPATGDEHVLVPEPQLSVLPAEPIHAPSQISTEPLTAPSLGDPSVEPLTCHNLWTCSHSSSSVHRPTYCTCNIYRVLCWTCNIYRVLCWTCNCIFWTYRNSIISYFICSANVWWVCGLTCWTWAFKLPDLHTCPVQSVLQESAVSQSGSASSGVLPDEMPHKTQPGPVSTGEPAVPCVHLVEEPVAHSFIDQLEVFPPQTHVNKFIIWFISLTKVSLVHVWFIDLQSLHL